MRSSAELLCIEPGQLTAAVWPACRHLIERAILKTGLADFAKIERDVLEGRHLLWLVWNKETIEAAVTTELAIANGVKTCVIVACSGAQRERWLHLISQIEDYARAEDCSSLRIIGRRAWERELDGFRARYAIMDKDLMDGRFQPNHQFE